MKTIVVILVCVTVLALAYIFTRPKRVLYDGVFDRSWPVTWTYDWSGGPGYDRREIMRQRGPYHRHHGPPRVTRERDGTRRRG